MKKSKFTGEQIAFALRQAEVGTAVADVCRKMGISEATFYRWKQLYGGLGPSELRKTLQLEEENQKLKRLVADLSLDKAMLQEVLSKKYSAWPASGDRPLGSGPVPGERTARRLAGEREARSSALSTGGIEFAGETPAPARHGGATGGAAIGLAAERDLGDGLRVRRAVRRKALPRADRSRYLYPGVLGDPSRPGHPG